MSNKACQSFEMTGFTPEINLKTGFQKKKSIGIKSPKHFLPIHPNTIKLEPAFITKSK